MSLEDLNGTKYIDALDSANPLSADDRVEGDDHIRGIKNTIKNTFPNITGAMNADQTELNVLDGATAGTAVASKALVVDTNSDIDLVTGDLSATDVTATGSLVGTLSTAAQPNITEVGTLTAGNVDAAVSAASPTTAGKIATATQAEVDAGTVTDEAVTPATLANYSGLATVEKSGELILWNETLGSAPAFTNGSISSAVAHTLSGVPDLVVITIECVTAQGGYITGDEVQLSAGQAMQIVNHGSLSFKVDATNVTAYLENPSFNTSICSVAGSGGTFFASRANWKMKYKAFKF